MNRLQECLISSVIHEDIDVNNTIKQLGQTDTCRISHPATAEYTFQEHMEHFSKIDNMLGHEISLSKFFKKIETIQYVINYKRVIGSLCSQKE